MLWRPSLFICDRNHPAASRGDIDLASLFVELSARAISCLVIRVRENHAHEIRGPFFVHATRWLRGLATRHRRALPFRRGCLLLGGHGWFRFLRHRSIASEKAD